MSEIVASRGEACAVASVGMPEDDGPTQMKITFKEWSKSLCHPGFFTGSLWGTVEIPYGWEIPYCWLLKPTILNGYKALLHG